MPDPSVGRYDTPGNDTIQFGSGDDALVEAYGGFDSADGAAGRDLLYFTLFKFQNPQPGAFTFSGTEGPDGFSGSATWGSGQDLLNFSHFEDFTFAGLSAGNFNDSVTTGSGNDTVNMTMGGSDILNLGAGFDTLSASDVGTGTMSITSSDANGYNGTITSFAGTLTFTGIDVFNVFGGSFLIGGDNNDILDTGSTDSIVHGMGGNDRILGSNGNDQLFGQDGNDTISASGGNDELYGGAGDDTMDGGTGNDRMFGEDGNDSLTGGVGDDSLYGGAGDDTLSGGDGNDSLFGDAGNDILSSGHGTDVLNGGDGDDTLSGGTSSLDFDTLNGDDGNDRLVLFSLRGAANGGAGDDVLQFAASGYDLQISAPTADPGGGYSGVLGSHDTPNTASFSGIERFALSGSGNQDDNVTTGDGNDTFAMGDGSDVIDARGGDDVIDGGTGADTMIGGAGNDTYYVDNVGDVVVENPGEGIDTIIVQSSLRAYSISDLPNVENLTGTQLGQRLTGNSGDNVITGGAGNDAIIGLGGHDTLVGGAGNDAYILADGLATIVETVGGGNDTVYVTTSYTLNAGAEVETLSVYDRATPDPLVLTGNEFSQTIYGNAGDNALIGGGGTDVMYGLGGNDSYVVDSAGDQVIEATGGGNDTVYTTVSYGLAAGSEVETLTTYDRSATDALNLSGNEFGQIIYGNNGDNFINGGGGTDTLYGLGGNDAYLVDSLDDQMIEAVGGGNDTVYASGSFVLTAGSEIEVLSVYDRSTTNPINLAGNEFAQTIYGNAGNNFIDGKGGSDTIYLMGGTDTVVFSTPLGPSNVDTVNGFTSGDDKLWLDSVTFSGLTPGALNPNAFFAGPAAHDADDRIIYDSTTGNLYFDADGNGAGAAVQFAHVDPGTIIAASDFQVI